MPRTTTRKPCRPATVRAVAEYASCSSRTVYRWVREGRLPAWRLGAKSLRIDLDDVDALFQRIPTASGK